MKLSVLVALASISNAIAATPPICIVGAGPAGLAAAHALEEANKEVVIFEKQEAVGGKCQAYYDKTYHPLGAVIFENQSYPETLKVISQTNVTATYFKDLEPKWTYDWQNGSIGEYKSLTLPQKLQLAIEVSKYSFFWYTTFKPISGIGYREGIPETLTVPLLEWMKQKGYHVLPSLMNFIIFTYGYGDIREIPAWYAFQLFPPSQVLASARILPSYIIDYHNVFVQYAETIKGKVHLNAVVSNIDRSGASPKITYKIPSDSEAKTQTCSALILAFPPAVSVLEDANLDITPKERELFSRVKLNNYFSGAVSMSSNFPAHQPYAPVLPSPELPPKAEGQPVGFIRFFDESPVATTWSWGEQQGDYTEKQARDLLIETLSKLNKNPNNVSAESIRINEADVKGFRKNAYFPTVSSKDLASQWYLKLDQQQGQEKTFFASGLNGLETVEWALRAGFDVVEHYILPREL